MRDMTKKVFLQHDKKFKVCLYYDQKTSSKISISWSVTEFYADFKIIHFNFLKCSLKRRKNYANLEFFRLPFLEFFLQKKFFITF